MDDGALTMINSEIIRLATIANQPDEYFTPERQEAFLADLDKLDGRDSMLVTAASKLLAGKVFAIDSDNPQTITAFRALAEYMGIGMTQLGQKAIQLNPVLRH
jgi:hypothetical protein